ncbi:hypothetical protein SDC9_134033 [bioreactor metagenome]|uniref:Xylose isomerase-like TIM barrel domain-containing protein n=1 Tax=bioreactor metagenome TaxID=1076179 RepID=A0A645DBU0_9ZZZZ
MKLGIFGLPDPKMTFTEEIDYAKASGLSAIEPFPVQEFATPDVVAAKRLKEYAEKQGIDICCFSYAVSVVGEDCRTQIENLKRYADVAAALGSPYLHHTIYPVLSHDFKKMPFKQLLKRAVDSIREVYDYAEQTGVKCIYEDQGYIFNGCERFDALLNEVNRDIGLVADLGNILFVGETPEEFVGHFAPYISHVHVKDYLFKSGNGLYPGEEWYNTRNGDYLRGTVVGHGTVDFEKILKIPLSTGYEGYYSMEYDGLEDAMQASKIGQRNIKRYYEAAKAHKESFCK